MNTGAERPPLPARRGLTRRRLVGGAGAGLLGLAAGRSQAAVPRGLVLPRQAAPD